VANRARSMNRRFALIQILFSVVALGAVVWWASRQDAPEIPSGTDAIAWLAAAVGLYAVATVVRAERWRAILEISRIQTTRRDCYGLTTVGYMGNNVLPARAGEALRVVLLDARTDAGKRKILGTIVAERMLDAIALGLIFVLTVYLVLEGDVVPTDEPALIAGICFAVLALAVFGLWVLHRRGGLHRLKEVIRPLLHAPRALLNRQGLVLLVVTFALWAIEGAVYLAVARAVDLHISTSGALYLVALTNFVAALPAAPGSIGTFDAAVAFGAKALGASGSVAVTYLLLLRFVLYVPITIVGLVVLVARYGGWARLRQASRLETSSA
jgi:glycosyltransferase 2 family protein